MIWWNFSQMFYSQLSQVVTAWGFLLLWTATLDVCDVMCCRVWAKLLPKWKPVLHWERPLVVFFILLLILKCHPVLIKLVTTAAFTLISLAAASFAVSSCTSSSSVGFRASFQQPLSAFVTTVTQAVWLCNTKTKWKHCLWEAGKMGG